MCKALQGVLPLCPKLREHLRPLLLIEQGVVEVQVEVGIARLHEGSVGGLLLRILPGQHLSCDNRDRGIRVDLSLIPGEEGKLCLREDQGIGEEGMGLYQGFILLGGPAVFLQPLEAVDDG